MIDGATFEFVLFRTVDRIFRFYRHIHDFKYENMDYYADIISEIDSCLRFFLDKTVIIVQKAKKAEIDNDENIRTNIKSLLNIIDDLRDLHSKIGVLPIMGRPIELLRFKRLFKEGLKDTSDQNFSIGFGEITNQEVHLRTPVSEFRDSLDKKYSMELADDIKTTSDINIDSDNPQSHITIPRVEFKNPLAWPIVAHEISHRLIDLW